MGLLIKVIARKIEPQREILLKLYIIEFLKISQIGTLRKLRIPFKGFVAGTP